MRKEPAGAQHLPGCDFKGKEKQEERREEEEEEEVTFIFLMRTKQGGGSQPWEQNLAGQERGG